MQNVITWEQLLMSLVVFLFVYYALILFIFYRHDLPFLSSYLKKESSLAPYLSGHIADSDNEEPENILYNSVHELMEKCKPLFNAAAGGEITKEYLLNSLRLRVQKYPQLKGTAFQIAVSNHIEQEIDHRLGITLTDSEIDSIWR
ncbi:MAG TPA: hypothetical protein PKE30_02590 [Niabella sp.]|nr:hypothetical protein [Niabella sp.]